MPGAIADLVRWVGRCWPRRLVLLPGGDPVELVHVVHREDHSFLVVELRNGVRLELGPEALASRLCLPGTEIGACVAVALAGLVAGLSVAGAPAIGSAGKCAVPAVTAEAGR